MGEHSASGSEEQPFLPEVFLAYCSLVAAAVSIGRDAAGLLVLLAEPRAAVQTKPQAPTSSQTRALAARIAGAATLLVCAEEAAAKAAIRSGASDFLVAGPTGLDEALRILKNELRRGAGIGVCLHASPEETVQACVERGVQPDLLDYPQPCLLERGAALITWQRRLASGQRMVRWHVESGPLTIMSALDEIATSLATESNSLRQRWLQTAPALLGRTWQKTRLLPMTPNEIETFAREAQAVATANGLALHVAEGERSLRLELT